MVERLAEDKGVEIPGEGAERDNRVAGLGPLLGIGTGVGVGLGYALLDLHLAFGAVLSWTYRAATRR